MYFNSIDFAVFFAIVYPLYLAISHRRQNVMLLIASYVFYGWWDWRFLSLLLFTSFLDYYCAIMIHDAPRQSMRKLIVTLSIICNLGLLGFFKYFGFFSESLITLMNSMGLQANPWSLKIILPVGISFYTFQSMSYTIDVYRRKYVPCRDFLDFALYVSFFPQLVAGPIERGNRLLPQVIKPRRLNVVQIREGIFLIAWGLFKKIIIADNAARIADNAFANYTGNGIYDTMLGLYAFVLQIYGDFSGYSDIARGLAKLMGFELMVNFRLPYFAINPVDFWARWHISLTTWVRDYLYMTIAKGSKNKFRAVMNNLISMTTIGLWHGASWTFVLWGFCFGVVQAVYVSIRSYMKKLVPAETEGKQTVVRLLSMALMFNIFVFSGVLFRAENLHQTFGLLKSFGRGFVPEFLEIRTAMTLLLLWLPILIMQIAQYRSEDLLVFMKIKPLGQFGWWIFGVYMVVMFYLFGGNVQSGEQFIYFQF